MDLPLLSTKLHVPPLRPNLVGRPHLIQRLDEGWRLGRKLTLISAPAGFGKTTLLSEWVHGLPERQASPPRVAWLSLDEADNDPARFLTYLAAALHRAIGGPSGGPPGTLPQSPPMEAFLTGLINHISAVPTSFMLVLDDVHLITAQPIYDAISFLLDHLPANLHVAIATRADPPLPVARLRGRGQLTELRLQDLRFAAEEADEFLHRIMALEITSGEVAALASRTEGWIAGLQMAAIALQAIISEEGNVADFVQSFTGGNRFILDYLMQEVLQHQTAQVQAFLHQTSILDRLCGPLCDAVVVGVEGQPPGEGAPGRSTVSAHSAEGTLAYLERANLFVVPLDDRREWYRYHRLFADLLRARLGRLSPDLVPLLHQRASRWYEEAGLTAEAIDHALAARDLERAADLIDRQAEVTLMRGEAATFLRWVDTLPQELVAARPELSFFCAWMELLDGQPLKIIESHLERVEQRGGALVAGRVAGLRALMAALRAQIHRTAELSQAALEQLPEEERFVRPFVTWLLYASQLARSEHQAQSQVLDKVLAMSQRTGNVMVGVMALTNQAELLMRQGALHAAAAMFRRALEAATDAQGEALPIAAAALIGLGAVSREWGDLDEAARYLGQGIELAEQWTEVGPMEAYMALARVRQAQGDMDDAQEAIRKARELAARFDLTRLDDLSVALAEAQMQVASGDLAAARRWAESRDLFTFITSPLQEEPEDAYDVRMRKYELLVLMRLLIALGRHAEALAVAESLVPIARRRGRQGMLIEIHLLQALARHGRGDTDQAMAALERALHLAEPEGYVQVFADEGEPVAGLLREAVARGIAVGYASKLLTMLHGGRQPEMGPATATLVEPLTEREMDVLRFLDTYLSSTEIAERLYISPNTARYHIKHIYAKLDVHGRDDAVQRARELGLL